VISKWVVEARWSSVLDVLSYGVVWFRSASNRNCRFRVAMYVDWDAMDMWYDGIKKKRFRTY
jgi:hypothetical protein